MIKNIPLKHKLIFGGVIAVVIPFLMAGTIIYIQLSNSLLEMTKAKAAHEAKDIAELIDANLMLEIKLVSAIAADPDIVKAAETQKYQAAQEALEAIHNRIGRKYFTIALLDRNGIVRADALYKRQIGLNLSDREYFLRAKKGHTSVFGPVFPRGGVTPDTPIIIVAAPIKGNDEFYGATALLFNTEFLENIISNESIGQTGYAYVLNAGGLILSHPRKEFVLKLRLFDRPGTEEIKSIVQGDKNGSASYRFEGFDKIAGLSYVKLTGWITVFTQNRDEIMAPVDKILSSIVISGMIFLAITISIIILFSGRISNPIDKVVKTMAQVTQHSTEIILQIGLDRKIFFANPAFEVISGLKSEDIIGTEPELINYGGVQHNAIWDSLEKGITWSGRIELKGGKPEPVILDTMLIPLKDESGEIQGYLQIGRDITEELKFEKKLQQAQRLEAMGTLAGGIAHDFNNILGGIFGYGKVALLEKDSPTKTENNVRQIIKAAERARDLVSQILTFSRETEVDLRPLLPKIIVKEALKLLRATTKATIAIETKISSDSTIMAEPTQIHQIMMNLFTNAAQAIGENSGTITLELEDFIVDEGFAKSYPNIEPGKHVLLRVSDTGSGIKPEVLEHVFEPFYTTKHHGEGTGLGLSVVHGIVDKLGGIATVYSEVGKGTTFNVILPVIEGDEAVQQIEAAAATEGNERILIIDDEAAIVKPMEYLLRKLGYKATAFMDGLEAMAAMEANPDDFDLVVTDLTMPGITGVEIAIKMKQAGMDKPVILTSGYFEPKTEEAAREAGIMELVTKPIDIDKLASAIRKLLENKRA